MEEINDGYWQLLRDIFSKERLSRVHERNDRLAKKQEEEDKKDV